MKKRISVLVLALTLIFTVSAAAITPRGVNPIDILPNVAATSSGVTCTVKITFFTNVSVSGTITLYRDDSYLISWPINDVEFERTYTPVRSGEYRMEYDITVKGPAGTDHLTGSEFDTY